MPDQIAFHNGIMNIQEIQMNVEKAIEYCSKGLSEHAYFSLNFGYKGDSVGQLWFYTGIHQTNGLCYWTDIGIGLHK